MAATLTRGESQAARFVEAREADETQFLHKSAALGVESLIRGELAETWEDCREQDWDGYNALPLSWDSLANAKRVLLALPLGTRLPSIGAIPDGSITLEWHSSRRRTLTVIVGLDGDLHYAALLGPGRAYGSLPFFGEVPRAILDLIAQINPC